MDYNNQPAFTGCKDHLEILLLALEKHNLQFWNNFNNNLILHDRCADLKGLDLSGAFLEGINFWKADLRGSFFRGSDLREADLQEAQIEGINLREADLFQADLQSISCREGDFSEANLEGANLGGGVIRDSDLSLSHLQNAKLRHTFFIQSSLRGVDLRYADLQRARLINVDLTGAWLFGSRREGWKLEEIECLEVVWHQLYREYSHYKPGEFEKQFKSGFEMAKVR